ncbi:hypothetical protein EV424DRAFT_1335151, partial [Suillus variegatus]
FCPFDQQVWVFSEEKGIPCQYEEVNPHGNADINPKNLAIEYWQGKALYESLILYEFFEEAYPTHCTPGTL